MKTEGNRNYWLIKGIKLLQKAPDLPMATIKVLENIIEMKKQDKDVWITKGARIQETVVSKIMIREEETMMTKITKRMKKDILKNILL